MYDEWSTHIVNRGMRSSDTGLKETKMQVSQNELSLKKILASAVRDIHVHLAPITLDGRVPSELDNGTYELRENGEVCANLYLEETKNTERMALYRGNGHSDDRISLTYFRSREIGLLRGGKILRLVAAKDIEDIVYSMMRASLPTLKERKLADYQPLGLKQMQ